MAINVLPVELADSISHPRTSNAKYLYNCVANTFTRIVRVTKTTSNCDVTCAVPIHGSWNIYTHTKIFDSKLIYRPPSWKKHNYSPGELQSGRQQRRTFRRHPAARECSRLQIGWLNMIGRRWRAFRSRMRVKPFKKYRN